MEENNFQSRADRLINWSKWVITLSFTSGLGCVIAMKSAADAALQKTGFLFFYAILFFCASMVCAVIFVFFQSNENKPVSASIPFLCLGKLQLALFVTGILFVLIWIGILSKII